LFALWTPAGTPDEVIKALVPAVEKAVKATKPKIEQLGVFVNISLLLN